MPVANACARNPARSDSDAKSPGAPPACGEQPDEPRRRAGESGQAERPCRVGPVVPGHEPHHGKEKDGKKNEDEMRPNAEARGREEPRREPEEPRATGGNQVAPPRLVGRAPLLGGRETRERAEEESGRGRVRERAPPVHPHDGQREREDDSGERRPPAHDAPAPDVQRRDAAGGEQRRRGRERVERRDAERQQGTADQDPYGKPGRLR